MQWLDYYNNQGERVRESAGTTSRKEAERILKEREGRVARGERVVSRKVTWDDLRDALLDHYRSTGERNVDEAMCRIGHLNRHFSGVKADQIDGPAVSRYIVARLAEVRVSTVPGLRKKPQVSTVNREVALLMRALRLGAEQGRLGRVPVVHLADESKRARTGFLEPAQFGAIRSHLPADAAVIVSLLYDGAHRLREITHLRRDQIDLARGCIRLRQSKTGALVAVYLTPETLDLLRAHLDRVRELEKSLGKVLPMAFPIMGGFGVSRRLIGTQRDSFVRAWETATTAAGFPGKLVHDCRRSAIRNLIRAGVHEKTVMSISGHTTRSTFDRYNITSETDLQDAATKLDAARKAASGATGGTVRAIRRAAR
jgi:integrase